MPASPASARGQTRLDSPLRISSKELFANTSEVLIEHCGEQYRLRITRQGKLILTK